MNIKRGIKKLDEVKDRLKFTSSNPIVFADQLREILLAMDEPLGTPCYDHHKQLQKIERRLALLEKNHMFFNKPIEQPSPPVECKHDDNCGRLFSPECKACKPVQTSATTPPVEKCEHEWKEEVEGFCPKHCIKCGITDPVYESNTITISRGVAQYVIDNRFELPNELYDEIKKGLAR